MVRLLRLSFDFDVIFFLIFAQMDHEMCIEKTGPCFATLTRLLNSAFRFHDCVSGLSVTLYFLSLY